MGNTLTDMKSNDGLVDFLVFADFIKSKKIQQVFRAVDRKFYLPQPNNNIHKDIAVKLKNFHMSAPSVYATVLENLDLRPGLSFLNIGSGTGYLSTMVGLLLGCSGVNHGIELYPEIVEFAEKRVKSFMHATHATDFSNFNEPLFTVGNFFNLMNPEQKYDRVYCGGSCPEKYENLLYQLVKDDGILIRGTEDGLLKLTRSSKKTWNCEVILAVCFFNLATPDSEMPLSLHHKSSILLVTLFHPFYRDYKISLLDDVQPSRLQNICRSYIRSRLKDSITREKFIRKKNIKGMPLECLNPINEPLFDHDEGEYLINDVIPRDMDVLMTNSLQRFAAREIQRKRINEDYGETQPSSDCANYSKQILKTNPSSASSISEENYSSQNLNSSEKCSLIHPDKSPKDNKKQQDYEPMTGINDENWEKELRVNRWSSHTNSISWHKLPNFEDIFQKSSPLVEVSFSELMNQKIQDLPLTQFLKDFLK